jgi:inorganic pyrophosphatase
MEAVAARDEESGLVNVVIDTPRGSSNKYKCDERTGLYKISRILPAGMHFPCDFGSVPQTCAEDGDPLDALVLIDSPTFPGCLMTTKVIGALRAQQKEHRRIIRNDRLIAVPVTSVNPPRFRSLRDIEKGWLREIEAFFVSYNRIQGREFRVTARLTARSAGTVLSASEAAYRKREPKR